MAYQLFVRMTYAQYKKQIQNWTPGSLNLPAVNQQVIYITDKDLYVHRKNTPNTGWFDIIYSRQYGSITTVQEKLGTIQQELIPGLYITKEIEDKSTVIKIWYFDGIEWKTVASTSSLISSVQSVNHIGPVDNNITITANDINAVVNGQTDKIQNFLIDLYNNKVNLRSQHQYYGTSNYQSDNGNVQVSGYLEGMVDGGGW